MTAELTDLETVVYASGGGVARITLSRPEKLNAFSERQFDELRKALEHAGDAADVRVAVVSGAAGNFSSGADVGEWAQPPATGDGEPHGFPPFMATLIAFEKPLIAAVDGVAVGIGLTMLLHCDFVIVSDRARLRAPFVSMGIVPEAGASLLLPRIVGRQAASEIVYRSGWISAERAVEIGLAWRMVPAVELDEAAMELAAEIARFPASVLGRAKRLMLASEADLLAAAREREDQALLEAMGSAPFREAVQAFMQKRDADFSALE